MTVNDLHGKFVYHLEEMYYVENQLLDAIDEWRIEVTNDDLEDAFNDHRRETKNHVDRLQGVFTAIGEDPRERRSPTFDALLQERSEFFDQAGADEDMRDLHDVGVASKAEHLEIAGYENLLMLARELDLGEDVRDPIERTLDEERAMNEDLQMLTEESTIRKIFGRLGR